MTTNERFPTAAMRQSLAEAQRTMGRIGRHDVSRDLASIMAWLDNPPQLAITLEGGIVQALVSERPAAVHLSAFTVIDYDTDDADDEDLTLVPQSDGDTAEAYTSQPWIEQATIDLAGIRPKIEPDDVPDVLDGSERDGMGARMDGGPELADMATIDCNVMRTEAEAIARQIEGTRQ